MKFTAAVVALLAAAPVFSQQQPIVKTSVDEVLLDLVVRDKKGKPITDLKPEDIAVSDNSAKQAFTSFRLVRGAEAISSEGTATRLDPLRQIRLVTLAFEALSAPEQRKLARAAALDLIKGDQGTNVFYSVVVIDTRLLVLSQFTRDQDGLTKAIERATEGIAAPRLASESDALTAELRRNQGPGVTDTDLLAAATDTAAQPVNNGSAALQAKLAAVLLDMLKTDAAVQSQGTRLSLGALRALVDGMREVPGRKSVLYFTAGMYLTPDIDVPFRNLKSIANRANVTFYSVDVRGVMTASQNSEAIRQMTAGARASNQSTVGDAPATKEQMKASDTYEVAARANIDLPLRDLAESTGGFLIGDSNDLRQPLHRVNEEISSYYEVSYRPGIEHFDGSFRKISVSANRKDLVIHARNGYFALPPEARAAGLQSFEVPLLDLISSGKAVSDLKFHAGAVVLQPKAQGTSVAVLVEVPLHELQPKADIVRKTQDVHCSLLALVKDAKGEVVQKLSRDRSFQVTPEQLKAGNFVDKMSVVAPPGKYTLESAVIDDNGSKAGVERSEFTVAPHAGGVAISSLTPMRGYTPNAKGLDPEDPFQFQGGSVTPTLDFTVKKVPDAMLRLFFTVYQDPSISAKPSVEIEFRQGGQSLTKVPMQLPAADSQGRIPYLMTIPAASIPPGVYEVHAVARQGSSNSESVATVRIEQ
jgi:VWFA-related protein